MIVPWLRGFLSYHKAPVIWSLFFLNVVVYSYTSVEYHKLDVKFEEQLNDQVFLDTQGKAFANFITHNPQHYSKTLVEMAKKTLVGHTQAGRGLAGLAIRDRVFLDKGAEAQIFGDTIAIQAWREKFKKIKEIQRDHPGHKWGVSLIDPHWTKLISYQFVHGGFAHLMTNMFFMLLFGFALEVSIGSLSVLFFYLLTGFVAALTFQFASGLSMAPLVGASGAVNGLVGLFAALYWKKRWPFIYFILPRQGYWGFVRIPTWAFFIFWIVSDIASLMASVGELGGVAYTAHIGGILSGLLVGGLIGLFSRSDFIRRREPSSHRVL